MVKEDEIVYLSPELIRFIAPRESALAIQLMQEFSNSIEYIDFWPDATKGVYARVLNVVTLRQGGYIVDFSTFAVSTGTVKLLMLQLPDTIELTVVQDPDILAAIRKNDGVYLATLTKKGDTPTQAIKPKTRLEELNEVIELVYPERYGWNGPELYIHWPELELKNSNGTKRILRDLVVKLTFSADLKHLVKNFEGLRYTLNNAEINVGYDHSHLNTYARSFQAFCLGHSSMQNMMMTAMNDVDPDWFFGFLHHLDQYVKWESLEGGPYIRMSEVSKRSASNVIQEANMPVLSTQYLHTLISDVLSEVKSSDILKLRGLDGGVMYKLKLDGESGDRLCKVINHYCPGQGLVRFDPNSGQYFNLSASTRIDNEEFYSRFLRRSPLKVGYINLSPQVADGNIQAAVCIDVASPVVHRHVIDGINLLLNYTPLEYIPIAVKEKETTLTF